jgi:drug/metabolite transporter (DMT)-like permease
MPIIVFAGVLLAAALHASWNAVIKDGGDKVLSTILVASSAALAAACMIPFVPLPAAASHPYIAASVAIHVVYFVLVARAYRVSDMGLTYPLMRGTAPFLVATASAEFLGEPLAPAAWAGVALISLGILTMVAGRRSGDGHGVGVALLNAGVIAAYTLTDGAGVRVSGSPLGYAAWVFLLSGVPLAAWVMTQRRAAFLESLQARWQICAVAGTATVVSYGLIMWAMTQAPVAIIAALRETSILFGTALAGIVLKEKLSRARIAGACLIALGAVALRLA